MQATFHIRRICSMFNGCLKCNLVSSPLFSHNDVPWMSSWGHATLSSLDVFSFPNAVNWFQPPSFSSTKQSCLHCITWNDRSSDLRTQSTQKKEKNTKKKRKTQLSKNETSSRLFLLVFFFLSRYLASRTCSDCLTERAACPLCHDQPATRRLLLGVK